MLLKQIEEVSAVAKRLKIEVEPEEVAKALDKTYKQLGRQVSLKGFRPGKAPRSILERYYGPQISREVAEELIKAHAPKAIEESGLKPVVEPKAEPGPLEPAKPFEFSLLIEIAPVIEPEGYLGLSLKRRQREITEELVAAKLEELRQTHATLEAVEVQRPVQAGDYVLVDMIASQNSKPLKGGRIANFDIHLGRGRFHPEVEKALEGMKVGEEKTVKAAFPQNFFHDALAGREVELSVLVKEVRQTVLPELNDDLAKSLNQGFETLEDLKARIRQELEKAAGLEADRRLQDQALDEILEKNAFEVPEGLVDRQLGQMIASVERSLALRGMSFQSAGIFEEKLAGDLRPQALRRVKEDLILEAIAKKEGLEIDEAALNEGLKELAEKTDQNVEEVRRFQEEHGLIESFRAGLLRQKTLKRLLDGANIEQETYVEEPAA